MSTSESTAPRDEGLWLQLRLWHPGCWVLEVTDCVDIGLLGYGVFTRPDGSATTRYTVYADDTATIDAGIDVIRDHPAVDDAVPMTGGFRQLHAPSPGNATQGRLVDHDATTQISDALVSRGFIYAAPCDVVGNEESWSLYATTDRETVQERLDEVRAVEDATITVESISTMTRADPRDPLPVDRLSHRQREVFQLARREGYYRHPRETSAEAFAAALGITTSTFHEHLHKAEQKLLDCTDEA